MTAPEPPPKAKRFVDLSIADLLSYVSERLIEKGDDADLIDAVNANTDVLKELGVKRVGNATDADRIVDAIRADAGARAALHPETRDIIERRIAEISREDRLTAKASEVAKIDSARAQKLLSMSAPLVSEMATALRRSADTLEVRSRTSGGVSSVLYLNKRMAQEIETATVDKEITPILGDIIQYNKENGWGKARISNASGAPISFSIPSDLKASLQPVLLSQMRRDQVYLQAYFVRDKGGEVIRLIVVGILPVPER